MKILKILFLLTCVLFAACSSDDEVAPAQQPNVIKAYLTKAEFLAQMIPSGNGMSRVSLIDDAMRRKVDSVLCQCGFAPDRLNFLQGTDEAEIDRVFSASVAGVERELTALNLLGKMGVYGRELRQLQADSTLELCYQKVFGDEKYTMMVGINPGFSDQTNFGDEFTEEFGEPDPFEDWNMVTMVDAEVRVIPDGELNFGSEVRVFTGDPYAPNSRVLASKIIDSEYTHIRFEMPKNLDLLYIVIKMTNGYTMYRPAPVVDGKCQVTFGGEEEE